MAERHRSKDGRRETEDLFGDTAGIDQQGRSGGRLARTVGTKDEQKTQHGTPGRRDAGDERP